MTSGYTFLRRSGSCGSIEIAAYSWESGTCCSYLPDVGEAIAQLMDRDDELADFDRFHCGGTGHAQGGRR